MREKREEEAFSDNEKKRKGRGWRFWWLRIWIKVGFGDEDGLGRIEVGFGEEEWVGRKMKKKRTLKVDASRPIW